VKVRTPPLPPSRVGKRGTARFPPDNHRRGFIVTGEIRRRQSNIPSKLICLQQLRWDDGRTEFRLAYYIVGKKGRARGRWVWGQYATMIPAADLRYLVREARQRGWI
jgi:hypothetical protein